MSPSFFGAVVNSALYLACVFAAGLATGNRSAWQSALLAIALTLLSHVLQLAETANPGRWRMTVAVLVFVSWVWGAFAAFCLLIF